MIGTTKAAELLDVSARRIRKLIAQGRVHGAYKIGGVWAIPTVNGYPQISTASRGPKPTWKRVKAPAENIIHINRQLIGKKMDDGTYAPPIAVKCRNKNTYSSRVVIPGPCVLIYDFENPQKNCGATVCLKTFSEPEIQDGCTFREIMDKNPRLVKPKTKPKKASGKGFGKKVNTPVAA
ncbi:MAG: helix-turn-helix domain-containing protein [Rivularia sp. (in: Bacteria)]|nr:helix-turn-helix domain-containing protein [Rivularia sp. MS3]